MFYTHTLRRRSNGKQLVLVPEVGICERTANGARKADKAWHADNDAYLYPYKARMVKTPEGTILVLQEDIQEALITGDKVPLGPYEGRWPVLLVFLGLKVKEWWDEAKLR